MGSSKEQPRRSQIKFFDVPPLELLRAKVTIMQVFMETLMVLHFSLNFSSRELCSILGIQLLSFTICWPAY